MTAITLQLSPELEQKLRESIARRDAQSILQLLADAFAPTVEALRNKHLLNLILKMKMSWNLVSMGC
ncbi:MAG: hypothetical protein PUP92_35710 [Rhizonema sp. PD38]|nr:hypothetical protein [Rhizonema sp. PD38]